MRLRGEHCVCRERHNWTPRVVRLRQLLDERLRRSRHQGQLDIIPVLANRVIHDGPALQQGLAFLWNYDAVRALPYRNFADIAHQQIAVSFARSRDDHAPDVLVARLRTSRRAPRSASRNWMVFGFSPTGRCKEPRRRSSEAVEL